MCTRILHNITTGVRRARSAEGVSKRKDIGPTMDRHRTAAHWLTSWRRVRHGECPIKSLGLAMDRHRTAEHWLTSWRRFRHGVCPIKSFGPTMDRHRTAAHWLTSWRRVRHGECSVQVHCWTCSQVLQGQLSQRAHRHLLVGNRGR